MREYIYLACPYSHKDEKVREERFENVTKVMAKLLEQGENVFSPITMSHPAVKYLSSPDTISHARWLEMDIMYLSMAKAMYLLCLDGWWESEGVLLEMEYACENDIPIIWLDPENWL